MDQRGTPPVLGRPRGGGGLDYTEEEREFFEERAAIAEYCGGLSRIEAEELAHDRVMALRARHGGRRED